MQKIIFDSGVKEYELGSGVLRFNPSDPNVYARFMDAADQILKIEQELVEKGKTMEPNGETVIRIMEEADRRTKDLLNEVFGGDNDFHKILGGTNLLAVGGNGERVITNLFNALTPIMVNGAQKCANYKVTQARQNRAQRRSQKHKK